MPDLRLTPEDRALLRALDSAFVSDPVPMVSVDMYIRAVEAADHITRENQRLHDKRRKLWKRYCYLRERKRFWRNMAIILAVQVVVLVFVLGRNW